MVPPPPWSTFPCSVVCHSTPSLFMALRTSAVNSACASFDPLLPRDPVNFVRHTPKPIFAAFIGSLTDAHSGSMPALTSLDKNFEFSGFRGDIDMNNLDFNIKKELDSCILLCNNCHTEEHCDIGFFEKYKNEIYEKVKNYCEKQKKLPINDIINLYKSGVKQNEIAKKYNASKGTICNIIKKYNINT